MGTLVNAGRQSRWNQRGQAAVEAALVILPLLAVLCAMIDFSVALFIRNSLVSAVRAGARYAITGQTGAGGNTCQDASIKAIVQQNAMGFLNGTTGLSRIQINYYDPATLADVTNNSGSNQEGHIVRITVSGVSWLWMLSGIWGNADAVRTGLGTPQYTGLTIGAASSDIMEPPPLGILPCR